MGVPFVIVSLIMAMIFACAFMALASADLHWQRGEEPEARPEAPGWAMQAWLAQESIPPIGEREL